MSESTTKKTSKTQHQLRISRIIFFYHYYLFNWDKKDIIDKSLDLDKYNFNDEEIKFIEIFSNNLEVIEKNIKENITNKWPFYRIEPFIKAVLVNSFVEIIYLKIDKRISINEALIILEEYAYESSKNMCNAILDKIKV